jgi:Ca2+-binding EF-hand superfamily protein
MFVMKRLLIATAVGALSAAAPAQNTPAGKQAESPRRADLQKRLDARFAQMDANKDGSLSRAEIESTHAGFVKLAKAMVSRQMRQEFTASDTNKDGKVSLAEMTVAAPASAKASAGKALQRLDTDKDNHVSLAEFTAAAPSPKLGGPDQFMQRFDGDKDGKVTSAEYFKPALAAFDLVDVSKDATLSAQERQAARKPR